MMHSVSPGHRSDALGDKTPEGTGEGLKSARKYQKRIYAKACLACRARKVKCLNPESPPCGQCKQGGFVCEVPDGPRAGTGIGAGAGVEIAGQTGHGSAAGEDEVDHAGPPSKQGLVRKRDEGRAVKRSRTSSGAPARVDTLAGLSFSSGAHDGWDIKEARGQDLEARVRRIEAYLHLNSPHADSVADEGMAFGRGRHWSHSPSSPLSAVHPPIAYDYAPHAAHAGNGHLDERRAGTLDMARRDGRYAHDDELEGNHTRHRTPTERPDLSGRTSHLRMKKEHLEHPRYSLGPVGQATYHGETSLFDDFSGNGGVGSSEAAGAGRPADVPLPMFASASARRHPSHLLHQSRAATASPSALHLGTASAPSQAATTFSLLQKTQEEEDMAHDDRVRLARRARHRYATPEEGEAYMDAHFCWASQTYGVVSRPLLLRDMAIGGPYFSQLLLLVLYLSGIRFTTSLNEAEREAKSERYFDIFMQLLMVEMRQPTKITTIQALLALAGRQCAVGKSNEGWLYTGMAIRMMQDMGIHLPLDDTSSSRFSAEEREMRTRLYWSAYNWDKTLALTLGREPALILRSGHSPDKITDESDDGSLWTPFFNGVVSPVPDYPALASHTVRVLRYSSRLNMILESILLNMYSPERPNARSLSFVRSAHERLDEFWQGLPKDLRLERGNMPAVCPPSNMVLLNLLYQVQFILLYRPLLSSSHQSASIAATSLDICRGAAVTAHDIFTMWGRTFGFVNMVYLMMYCCFVCAGVDVILLRVGNDGIKQEALGRVLLGLEILEAASSQGPGIRQGIATIRSQLERATRGEFAIPPGSLHSSGGAAAQSLATASGNNPTSSGIASRSLSATNLPLAPMPSLSLDNIAPRSLLHRRTTQQSNLRGTNDTAPVGTSGMASTLSTGLGPLDPSASGALTHADAGDRGDAHPAELLTLFAGATDTRDAAPSAGNGQDSNSGLGPSGGPDFSHWFDSVDLVGLLGELPVSSEDPFGFGTDWGGWQT